MNVQISLFYKLFPKITLIVTSKDLEKTFVCVCMWLKISFLQTQAFSVCIPSRIPVFWTPSESLSKLCLHHSIFSPAHFSKLFQIQSINSSKTFWSAELCIIKATTWLLWYQFCVLVRVSSLGHNTWNPQIKEKEIIFGCVFRRFFSDYMTSRQKYHGGKIWCRKSTITMPARSLQHFWLICWWA